MSEQERAKASEIYIDREGEAKRERDQKKIVFKLKYIKFNR